MNLLELSHKAGVSLLRERAWQQVWLDKDFYCLTCDLTKLPERPKAKVPVEMRPLDLAGFDGFRREFQTALGADAVEVYAREHLREAQVQTAYLARDDKGEPMYVHWLVTPETQAGLHTFQPGRYRQLDSDEALLEGAYTFIRFRGLGLMAAAEYQLLELARERGLKRVWTYVGVDNVPSLKGCARAGFVPDHIRRNHRRFGSMSTKFLPLTTASTRPWQQALGLAA